MKSAAESGCKGLEASQTPWAADVRALNGGTITEGEFLLFDRSGDEIAELRAGVVVDVNAKCFQLRSEARSKLQRPARLEERRVRVNKLWRFIMVSIS